MKRALLAVLIATIALPASAAGAEEGPALKVFGGLQANVEIVIDTFGFPHIYAVNEADAFFAIGYMHARDRLWQMDYNRRAARGKLSEIFGPKALDHDTFIRTIGLNRLAAQSAERIKEHPEIYHNLKAYAWGVNSYIAEAMMDGLPVEFQELQYKPEPWAIEDSLAIGKAMSWELCGSMDDLYLGALVEKLGQETVDELFPLDRYREIPIIPAGEYTPHPAPAKTNEPDESDGNAEACMDILKMFSKCEHILGNYKNIGSNNWAVSGKKSASGAPILASDPHLGFHMPAVWYAAHIKGGSLNVAGATLPGIAIISIGHNRHTAWGLTNTQADGTDFFVETLNEERTQYLHEGAWKPLAFYNETITVRGAEDKQLKIAATLHGPILPAAGQNIAVQWIGAEPDDDALAYSILNHADDIDDFAAAMQTVSSPPQNFVYADSNGVVAMWVAGLFPIRKSGLGRVPVDGSSGKFDWSGFIPRIDTPHSINPAQEYLASANQRPAPMSYPYYLGYEWDPGYRARRINQLLSSNDTVTYRQMQEFQADTFDTAAQSMLPCLIEACKNQFEEGKIYADALGLLSKWDFRTRIDKSAPTIWWTWLDALRDDVWKDEWQKAGIDLRQESWGHTDLNKWQPPLEVLERLVVEEPGSKWFDDVTTPEVETLREIAGRSFRITIDKLSDKYGPDILKWNWGRGNILRINHLSGDPILARGGQPLNGSDFALNARGAGVEVTGGPSWRMVVDVGSMGDAAVIYPGGQSGDPKSPHYDDLLDKWVNDTYIPLYFYPEAEQFPQEQVEVELLFTAPSDSEQILLP
jgi:penicillin amidase